MKITLATIILLILLTAKASEALGKRCNVALDCCIYINMYI
jgi:hypothetical protein